LRYAIGFLILTIGLFFRPTVLRADVAVGTSLNLTQLQILPSSGTLTILTGFGASAYAQAQDSSSGSGTCTPLLGFNQVTDASTSASCASAFASASASASSLSDDITLFSASAASGVQITAVPSATSALGEEGTGSLFGTFEIVSTGPPTLLTATINATLNGFQTLTTIGGGQFATSEIVFNLNIYSSDPTLPSPGNVLFLDNPLSIGPDTTLVAPLSSPNTSLTSTGVQLYTNTDYTLGAYADAESSGFTVAPEPSFSFPAKLSLLGMLLVGWTYRNRLKSRRAA
jgi:hypothetical protein